MNQKAPSLSLQLNNQWSAVSQATAKDCNDPSAPSFPKMKARACHLLKLLSAQFDIQTLVLSPRTFLFFVSYSATPGRIRYAETHAYAWIHITEPLALTMP